jgi:hypothetical protein
MQQQCCFVYPEDRRQCPNKAEWRIGQSDETATEVCELHRKDVTNDGDFVCPINGFDTLRTKTEKI